MDIIAEYEKRYAPLYKMDILVEYANKYYDMYKLFNYGVFHHACGCVIAQKIQFSTGRKIREALYKLCGFPLTQQNILKYDLTKINGLSEEKIVLLKEMASMEEDLEEYRKLRGFGPWSYNAVGIIVNKKEDINLASDKYIRKNIKLYNDIDNQKNCFCFLETAKNNKTKVCYFLWRLKPQSVYKILNNEILHREDFL